MHDALDLFLPWEFSPTVLLCSTGALALYGMGLYRVHHDGGIPSLWKATSFFAGIALIYAVLQTRFDYLAQHMFWIHRLQHLVLHHLGPFMIALAAPLQVLIAGVPDVMRRVLPIPYAVRRTAGIAYRIVQQPVIASIIFAGLIVFWLIPSVHFIAMLSLPDYNLMNWSMAIDGILFWWLILDPRSPLRGRTLGYGIRIAMLWTVMLPQILIGSYIALTHSTLYSVYAICGRIWPIGPLVDQEIGGLITWIPAAMMSVIGALVVLRFWLRDRKAQLPRTTPLAAGV